MGLLLSTLSLETVAGLPAGAAGPLDVPADGLTLVLKVPEVAPARLELTQAEFSLTAPSGTTELAGGEPGLVVATNLGPLSSGWSTEKDNDVRWLIADWGEPRVLVSITLSSTAAHEPNLGRLKISSGGAWFPPLPVETVSFNREQPLPDIAASRLMIEVVTDASGVLRPAETRLKGLTVKLAAQPFDVSVRVGAQPPLFERSGRLLPGQPVRIVDTLRDVLQRQVPRDGKATNVPLLIQAALPGRVAVEAARFSAVAVHSALDGAPASLPLDWGGAAVGRVTVGEGAELAEVGFTVLPELSPERLLLEGKGEEASAWAQRCDTTCGAAQGFPGLGEALLAGVDLLLRPTTPLVAGTVALHPDVNGRPAPAPHPGAQVPFTVRSEGPPPWGPRWVPAQLPQPLHMVERWWCVLTVSEGEALWSLAEALPALEGGLGRVLRRLGQGAWFPWEPPPPSSWALSRLRMASQAPVPSFQVELRRGEGKVEVPPAPGGRLEMSAQDLKALGTAGETLEVAVRSLGPPVAGRVRLGELRVVARLQDPSARGAG